METVALNSLDNQETYTRDRTLSSVEEQMETSTETPSKDVSVIIEDNKNIEPKESEKDEKQESPIKIEDLRNGEEDDKDKDEDGDEKKDSEKPLFEDESVTIEIEEPEEGQDTPTLPLPVKKKIKDEKDGSKKKGKLPLLLLHPVTSMRESWNQSSNILEFLVRATCNVFTTLGWLFCVGGVPFISLVMLIIGAIFVDDCPVQPKIPVYLIVSGVFGSLQHFISIWTKYAPDHPTIQIEGMKKKCIYLDALIEIFLAIWFILGCVWVYGIYQPDYDDPYKKEIYCHKTVYLFAFWILNLSFIVLIIIIAASFCCMLGVAGTAKDKKESPK